MLQMCETVVIKFGLGLMQVPMPFLDVFAYTGYKYVGLCISTLARGLGSTVGLVSALYTCFALAFFILKAMAAVVPTISSGPPRHLMLLGFATIQFFVPFILYYI
jgi:YIF1